MESEDELYYEIGSNDITVSIPSKRQRCNLPASMILSKLKRGETQIKVRVMTNRFQSITNFQLHQYPFISDSSSHWHADFDNFHNE